MQRQLHTNKSIIDTLTSQIFNMNSSDRTTVKIEHCECPSKKTMQSIADLVSHEQSERNRLYLFYTDILYNMLIKTIRFCNNHTGEHYKQLIIDKKMITRKQGFNIHRKKKREHIEDIKNHKYAYGHNIKQIIDKPIFLKKLQTYTFQEHTNKDIHTSNVDTPQKNRKTPDAIHQELLICTTAYIDTLQNVTKMYTTLSDQFQQLLHTTKRTMNRSYVTLHPHKICHNRKTGKYISYNDCEKSD